MTVRTTIESVVHGGHGLARIDGNVCLVERALPGDTVEIEIAKRTRGVLWGKLCNIVNPAACRCAPMCPYFGECGGCTWLDFEYPSQGEWKQRIVTECLQRIAGVECAVDYRENSALRIGYRTRAEFHTNGKQWGFHARRTNRVVPVEACPLCHERLTEAYQRLKTLRLHNSVELVVNPEGDQVLVWSKTNAKKLRACFANVNTRDEEACRSSFRFDGRNIVNGTFSQSSLLLNRVLVEVVAQEAGDAARVLDLYCGNGNLSAGLTKARHIVGLDHNRHAVNAAAGDGHGDYRTGDEAAFAAALRDGPWDVILLDPPRAGAKAIIPALADARADRMVYVSCDPATLARDVQHLASKGWRIARVTAVDMFPNTWHIETVCRMERG